MPEKTRARIDEVGGYKRNERRYILRRTAKRKMKAFGFKPLGKQQIRKKKKKGDYWKDFVYSSQVI